MFRSALLRPALQVPCSKLRKFPIYAMHIHQPCSTVMYTEESVGMLSEETMAEVPLIRA